MTATYDEHNNYYHKELRVCVNINVPHRVRKIQVQKNIDMVAGTKLFIWRTASSG